MAERNGFELTVLFLNFLTPALGHGFHSGRLSFRAFQNRNRESEFIPLQRTGMISVPLRGASRPLPERGDRGQIERVLREVEDLRLNLEFYAFWRADDKIPALRMFMEIVRRRSSEVSRR